MFLQLYKTYSFHILLYLKKVDKKATEDIIRLVLHIKSTKSNNKLINISNCIKREI